MREAVINAIVHNAWDLSAPLVEIFSNRIVVTSAGGLVEGLSQEDFFRCRSMPRNRELMRVFRDVDLVEHLGSGMSRILSAYDRSIFEFTPSFLVVTFPFEEGFTVPDGTLSGTVNGIHLSERIIEAIQKNPGITMDALAALLSRGRRTIARELSLLKDAGRVVRVGSDKTGTWKIIE